MPIKPRLGGATFNSIAGPDSTMNILQQQAGFNSDTRENWELFASHRKHTTDLICAATQQFQGSVTNRTLAILGVGNGNDLDLKTLAANFGKIHLFDFDAAALEHLRSQQLDNPEVAQSVVVEPPVDLTGASGELESVTGEVTEARAIELGDKLRNVSNVLPGRQFDLVVSTSLLTQLLNHVVQCVGDEAEFKNYLMIQIRDGHLNLMSRLIRPAGVGVLVTDFVSSDTLPELNEANTDHAVLGVSRKAIEDRNFFTGANPWAVKDSLAKMIRETPESPWSIAPPWRWQIGKQRSYAVTAITFSKSA